MESNAVSPVSERRETPEKHKGLPAAADPVANRTPSSLPPDSRLRRQCRTPIRTTPPKRRSPSNRHHPAWPSKNTRFRRSLWERHRRMPGTWLGHRCPAPCQAFARSPFQHPTLESASRRRASGRPPPSETIATPPASHRPSRPAVRSTEEGRRMAAPALQRRFRPPRQHHTKPRRPHRRNASRRRFPRQGETSRYRRSLPRTTMRLQAMLPRRSRPLRRHRRRKQPPLWQREGAWPPPASQCRRRRRPQAPLQRLRRRWPHNPSAS